jgi:hypothetical protein
MFPVLQVVTSELPVVPAELKGADVIQVFVGDDLPWDTPTFGGPGFAVLSHASAGLEPREAPFEYTYPRPFQIRWSLGPQEGPTWTDSHSLLPRDLVTEYVEEEDCFSAFSDRYFPCSSTKVGGWPCYIQDAPVVDGQFVLQVASEEKPRWMFGDNGTLYFYHRRGEWGVHGDCY